MPHAASFLHGTLSSKPLPVDKAFARIGIDGEISHLKCGEILKKVASLRRGNSQIAEASFDDSARSGNFVPLHRNAQPRIIRSPATHANQKIRCAGLAQFGVKMRDAFRDFLAAGALKAMKVDNHHVMHVVDAPIAHDFGTLADQPLRSYVFQPQFPTFARQN